MSHKILLNNANFMHNIVHKSCISHLSYQSNSVLIVSNSGKPCLVKSLTRPVNAVSP